MVTYQISTEKLHQSLQGFDSYKEEYHLTLSANSKVKIKILAFASKRFIFH